MSISYGHDIPDNNSRQLVRIGALNDQAWATIGSHYDKIEAMVEDESHSPLVRQMAALICGEIHFRGAKANAGV